ncbi:MAG: FKBP-type peptidyl-prolyl cis-trans isomerase [Ferruginibacter sp.]
MKKLVWITCSILFFAACKKNTSKCEFTESAASASQTERTNIENYLAANSLAAFQHTSGVFYNITTAGTGAKPNVCSVIRVKYSGYLFNGTLFDFYTQPSGISFVLGQLIVGWQKGLPEVAAGGSIILYIPPSLGYGAVDKRDANGNIVIPANSYLKFVIELMDVQ